MTNNELIDYLSSKGVIIENKDKSLQRIERYTYYSIVNTYSLFGSNIPDIDIKKLFGNRNRNKINYGKSNFKDIWCKRLF